MALNALIGSAAIIPIIYVRCSLVAVLGPGPAFADGALANYEARQLSQFASLSDGAALTIPTTERRMEDAFIDTNKTACGICRGVGTVLPLTHPVYKNDGLLAALPPDLSCQEIDTISAQLLNDAPDCTYLKVYFNKECCNVTNQVPLYKCDSAVRSSLLGDASGYDSAVAPIPDNGMDPQLNVSVSFTYYHLSSLSTVEGTAEIFVGIDMVWIDERLAWDPNEFGRCYQVSARASLDAEKTEIWVPDWDLMNRDTGLDALPDAMANVYADGTVHWYRHGGAKALCAFTGLERFPYDVLGCYFTFGSTLPIPVRYINNGLYFSDAHTSKYQEFSIVTDRGSAEYEEEDFLKYQFYFQRASRYYTTHIVIPTILFTMLSFGVFLLDIRVGERLAFGVSLLLVIVANAILTAGVLPVCGEGLWVNALSLSSSYWVMGALAESILVAYLYFLDRKDADNQKAEESRAERSQGCNLSEHTEEGAKYFGNEENGDVKETASRPKLRRRMVGLPARRLLIMSPAPSETWRMQVIRKMDVTCLILFPTSYIIFFSVMLARNKYW